MSTTVLNRLEDLEKHITLVPDFPKAGILFRDITPLLASPTAFNQAIDELTRDVDLSQIQYVAGVESRGFILASAIAIKFQKGFLPIRKKGKLPKPLISQTYDLEYGTDTLEMRPYSASSSGNITTSPPTVLLVDDVLATGGTIAAALKLCEAAGYQVKDLSFLINLEYLNSFKWKQTRPKAVLNYAS